MSNFREDKDVISLRMHWRPTKQSYNQLCTKWRNFVKKHQNCHSNKINIWKLTYQDPAFIWNFKINQFKLPVVILFYYLERNEIFLKRPSINYCCNFFFCNFLRINVERFRGGHMDQLDLMAVISSLYNTVTSMNVSLKTN